MNRPHLRHVVRSIPSFVGVGCSFQFGPGKSHPQMWGGSRVTCDLLMCPRHRPPQDGLASANALAVLYPPGSVDCLMTFDDHR